MKYRLHSPCTNSQAEQMANLKALEHTQYSKNWGKNSSSVYRQPDNTQNATKSEDTHLTQRIRTKVFELEREEWKVEFSWIKAHAGYRGNELADRLAKEAASNRTIECHTRIPKSAVLCDLNEQIVNQWQNEWEDSSKRAITKSLFPKISDRLKVRINATPNFNGNSYCTWQYQNVAVPVQNNRVQSALVKKAISQQTA